MCSHHCYEDLHTGLDPMKVFSDQFCPEFIKYFLILAALNSAMLPLTMRLEVFSPCSYLGVFPCKVSVHLKFWMNLILFSCVVPSRDEIKPIVLCTNI